MSALDKKPILLTPRIQGIQLQYRRAKRFVQLANRCRNTTSKFTNLIAAVYPACAIIELMLYAVEVQEIKPFPDSIKEKRRKEFKQELFNMLPYSSLLEKIRIHDFHRFGCLPPSQTHIHEFVGGPIKLKANKGMVSLSLLSKGTKLTVTGNSSFEEQRSLDTRNGSFFDDKSRQYVTLDRILNDFLSEVPNAITKFGRYSNLNKTPISHILGSNKIT